jgi:hypothetical protein
MSTTPQDDRTLRTNGARGTSEQRASVERHPREAGQAMLEFGMVVILFFISIFAAIQASFWAVENMAATAATEDGVRLASTAQGSGYSLVPAINQVAIQTTPPLRAAMVGTPVVVQVGSCPADPTAVWNQYGKPTVVECAYQLGGFVTVRVVGFGNAFLGNMFGFKFARGIPIDVQSTTHQLTFQG